MNPLVLIGVAIAYLALTGKPGAQAPSDLATQPGTPIAPDPIEPTFNNVPIGVKSKTPTTLQDNTKTLVAGISPPAPDSSPPYVYDLVSAGPSRTGWLGAMDSPAESYTDSPTTLV